MKIKCRLSHWRETQRKKKHIVFIFCIFLFCSFLFICVHLCSFLLHIVSLFFHFSSYVARFLFFSLSTKKVIIIIQTTCMSTHYLLLNNTSLSTSCGYPRNIIRLKIHSPSVAIPQGMRSSISFLQHWVDPSCLG